MKITINHLAKIEGHAGFFADILNGDIENAKIKVKVGARLIEGIVLNRNYVETPIVTSRICGICSVAHNLTSIKAMEDAFNIKITPKAEILRKILFLAEPIQSHAAHLFFLSLSDFFKYDNDLDLIKKYPDLTKKIVSIRDFGNKIKEVIGGRDMHLLSTEIGGFRKEPEEKELKKIYFAVSKVLEEAIVVAEFFKKLNYPDYERKVELVGLVGKNEYSFYKGEIKTSSGEKTSIKSFYKELSEEQTNYDPTKRVKHKGREFMVGAIARLNLSHSLLNPEAKKLLDFFGSKKTSDGLITKNTFHNIYAQAVELTHCAEEVKNLLDNYFKDKSKILLVKYRMRNGEGLATTEAPRGTLYHYYKVDRYGVIRECNIIPPTAQFLDSLENDLEKYLSEAEIKNDEDRKRKINMMVRAYDPCMTCATH